jgi:hypothetical protein
VIVRLGWSPITVSFYWRLGDKDYSRSRRARSNPVLQARVSNRCQNGTEEPRRRRPKGKDAR